MSDFFYKSFEDRYRGSRELITSRLRIYLPFVLPLLDIYPNASIVDLGCGRGEWLALMQSVGFDALGVDLDEAMLADCKKLGIDVHVGDAVSFLTGLPDASQSVVSGFHIAEHISFPDLQSLVRESLRILKPGGLLILETPNAENIVVGATNFYLDPTHQRPIPPLLLEFLPEHYGYFKTKTLRLQEPEEATYDPISLLTVLGGVSPDYAVVAQKIADVSTLEKTAKPFEKKYGITLNELASRYDQQVVLKIEQAEKKAEQAEKIAEQAEKIAEQAQIMAQKTHASLLAIYESSSWKLTAPLRKIMTSVKNLEISLKIKLHLLLRHAILYFNGRPNLKSKMLRILESFPTLKHRLNLVLKKDSFSECELKISVESLSPRARQIYALLKAEIDQKRGNH